MKRIKNKPFIILPGCFLMLAFFTLSSFVRQAFSPFIQDEIAQAINNDKWDFTADYAQPISGQRRNITGSYYVQCRKDTLMLHCPIMAGSILLPAPAIRIHSILNPQISNLPKKKEKRVVGW